MLCLACASLSLGSKHPIIATGCESEIDGEEPLYNLHSLEFSQNGRKFSATVMIPKDLPAKPTLLHYFHAAGSDEKRISTSRLGKNLIRHWEESGQGLPIIASLSLSRFWLVGARPRTLIGNQRQLEVRDLEIALLYLEHEIQKLTNKHNFSRRLSLGTSMGAFNSFQLLLDSPDFFDRSAFIALPTFAEHPGILNPLNYEHMHDTVNQAGHSNPLKKFLHLMGLFLFKNSVRYAYPTQIEWELRNPLNLILTGAHAYREALPPIYLSTGKKDGFGYFPANQALVTELYSAGFKVTWAPLEGANHFGEFNIADVTNFLTGRLFELPHPEAKD